MTVDWLGFDAQHAHELIYTNPDGAVAYLAPYVEQGSTRAMIAMAYLQLQKGGKPSGEEWIHRAEKSVTDQNIEELLHVWLHYDSFVPSGNGSFYSKLSMIERVALTGHRCAIFTTLGEYLTIGVRKGILGGSSPEARERFRFWADRASSTCFCAPQSQPEPLKLNSKGVADRRRSAERGNEQALVDLLEYYCACRDREKFQYWVDRASALCFVPRPY